MTRCRALVVVAVLVALAGCEDEPTPDLPDPTPSSTTPSPTESPPTASPTAEALTPEETVRAWVKAQNRALRTGETSGLRDLSDVDCQGCADYPDGIDAVYDAGGQFEGGQWSLVTTKVDEENADSARLTVAVRIAGGSTVSEAGAEPTVYEADSRLLTFEMRRVDEFWRISLIAFVS